MEQVKDILTSLTHWIVIMSLHHIERVVIRRSDRVAGVFRKIKRLQKKEK